MRRTAAYVIVAFGLGLLVGNGLWVTALITSIPWAVLFFVAETHPVVSHDP